MVNSTTASKAMVAAWLGGLVMYLLTAFLPDAFLEANPLPSEIIVGLVAYAFAYFVPADAKLPGTNVQ